MAYSARMSTNENFQNVVAEAKVIECLMIEDRSSIFTLVHDIVGNLRTYKMKDNESKERGIR